MVKRDELVKWLKENCGRINGGYISAYKNEYEMMHLIDSQYMDLEFEYAGVGQSAIRFLARDGYPASYTLDYDDVLRATEIIENENYVCKCKYVMLIKLRHKRIMKMYFDLKEELDERN